MKKSDRRKLILEKLRGLDVRNAERSLDRFLNVKLYKDVRHHRVPEYEEFSKLLDEELGKRK